MTPSIHCPMHYHLWPTSWYTYTGCSVNFKRRFGKHKRSVRKLEEKQTTFSTYIWKNFNHNGEEGRLQALQDTRWTPIARARPFNPGNGKCNLCLTEKWFIMFRPEGASLNQRSEIFSHCFHKEPQLLKNFKSVIKWIHSESWQHSPGPRSEGISHI